MSIFINTYESHAGQSLLPIPWSYRMIKKVLVRLGQSHNCECLKDNTTQHISHSLVEVAQRPWEEQISSKLPEPPHALFPLQSLLLFPRDQCLFSAFRNNDV